MNLPAAKIAGLVKQAPAAGRGVESNNSGIWAPHGARFDHTISSTVAEHEYAY